MTSPIPSPPTPALRLGSLCTGYGGLDLGVGAVLDVTHAWHAEIDPDASRVLARHWPDVPNLGDLTAVDWTRVEPVDVLTAGYPCQPLSLAGKRRGADDERWIWDDIARAIRALRPRLVVLENVTGHLSLGFGRVLGDLAEAGLDAEWGCVRASDVGAAHRRERVFVAAWPVTYPPSLGHRHARAEGRGGISPTAVAGGAGSDGLTLLPTPRASDGPKGGPNQRGSSGDLMLPSAVMLLPTASRYGNNQSPSPGAAVRPSLDSLAAMDRWGRYAAAITRWERVTGHPAPDPTEPGRNGQARLSPRFVEWMMGLPAGWVTDLLPRNPALRVLGNGVVPQQAAYAVASLLGGAS